MAKGEHNVDLWITLDPTRRNVVDVVVDSLNTRLTLATDMN
jgi:hypothetical protein